LSTKSVRDPEPDDWVTPAEAARMRGVSRQAIANLIGRGRFDVLRVGGRVFLRRADVESFSANPAGRRRS